MNIQQFGIGSITVALLVGLTSCSTPEMGPSKMPVTQLHASWADAYPSVAEMVKNSDAIVRGTVGDTAQTVVQNKIPYTDFAFHVSAWIKAKNMKPTEITIHQTGGIYQNVMQVVEDDPLLVTGTRYLLFLKEFAPSKYYILGGPTGRLNISAGGKLSAFKGSILIPAEVGVFEARMASLQAGTKE